MTVTAETAAAGGATAATITPDEHSGKMSPRLL